MVENQIVDDVPLLPLENQKFSDEFKRYYRHKRGNFSRPSPNLQTYGNVFSCSMTFGCGRWRT